jgi:hypothetical protein
MSQQEELERKAYHDLYRFAKTLAKIYGKRGHWLLDHDDLIGEQLYTLAKCIRKYLHVKPYNEFTALARVSMRNCVKSLIYRATLTVSQSRLALLTSCWKTRYQAALSRRNTLIVWNGWRRW